MVETGREQYQRSERDTDSVLRDEAKIQNRYSTRKKQATLSRVFMHEKSTLKTMHRCFM